MVRSYRYEEIAEDLREQIRKGELLPDQRLPGERVMMEQYGVQRNTVRQALTLLQREGWLYIRPRSGAFATTPMHSPQSDSSPIRQLETGTILVINSWNNSSTALDHILAGLSEVVDNTPLTVQRFNSHPRPGTFLHVLPTQEYLETNRVVGAILWAQTLTDLAALTALRAAVPLVLVDRRVLGFEADCVRFDDTAGGRTVTEHLISRGHRRIGFLGDEIFAETVQQRWRGYTLAMEDAGILPDPSRTTFFAQISEPMFSATMEHFLAGAGDPLTAVVCSNDTTALVLLRYLRSHGCRVPEDIVVTGYGNLLPEYMDTIDLTTMEQPFNEVGRVAGQLLCERLLGETPTPIGAPRQVQLPVRLIVRNSSNRTIEATGASNSHSHEAKFPE